MPGYNTTRYETQSVAMLYFYGALALFVAQVTFGVVAGLIYVLPNTLSVVLPFNIVRMIHTNALVVWLLLGFMGATYYLTKPSTLADIDAVSIFPRTELRKTGREGRRGSDAAAPARPQTSAYGHMKCALEEPPISLWDRLPTGTAIYNYDQWR